MPDLIRGRNDNTALGQSWSMQDAYRKSPASEVNVSGAISVCAG